MNVEIPRRGAIALTLAVSVGALASSETARDLLGAFAPLSGRMWGRAGATLPDSISSPYGAAELYRDEEGIPQIEAEDPEAAYYAVGYVQAFDRLFGMDLQRRIMRGTLSEVVGDMQGVVEDDVFYAKMDFAEAASAARRRNEGTEIEPIARAYVAGVNDVIENEPLPIEFGILDYEPAEWTLEDSMLVALNISWFLNGNFTELSNDSEVREALGASVYEELHPEPFNHDYPIIREDMDAGGVAWTEGSPFDASSGGADSSELSSDLANYLKRFESPESFGSNSWVVSGEHTESGRPIVANDPHLLLMVPPLLYEQHVLTPEANVRGFSFPGIPFAVFGANEYGAWGFTSESPNVLDIYTYEFDESGERYRYKGEWREVERETRELDIAGGETRTLAIEKTVHGPLIERNGQRVGVAWTGFGGSRSVRAMYDITRSESVDDVLEALEFMDIPSAAFVYADREEPLFYQTGKVPIRRSPDGEIVREDRVFDGSTPEVEWPGYEAFGETDWDGPGFIPFDEMPHVRDPSFLATANQGVVEEPMHYLGIGDGAPERAKRIWDTLEAAAEAGETMDLPFHEAIMTDDLDERAALAVPMIVAAIDDRGRDDLAAVRNDLAAWDFRMVPDSSAALVFDRWMSQYPAIAVEDVYQAAGLEPSAPSEWVAINLPPDSPVFVDRSRSELIVAALDAALEEIDSEGWSVYGDWNTTRNVTHPFGGQLPFLNYADGPIAGSRATPRAFHRATRGFAAGASTRMIVEIGEGASAMLPGGNSGDYFSPHYDDQFERYRDGEFRSMPLTIEGSLTTSFESE